MKKIGIIQISEAGGEIAATLKRQLGATTILRSEVGKEWTQHDAFVFIGAMGICVRTIAPYIEDKHTDPAVVCIDSMGKNVVSVLSGHVGGANALTLEIADLLDAHEVITTQSDNAGLWALDTLAERYGWGLVGFPHEMNESIFAFVNREPTALLIEACDEGTDYLEATKPDHVTIINDISEADPRKYKLLIIVSPYEHTVPEGMLCVHYIPFVGVMGFGLAHHPEDYEEIYDQMNRALTERGVLPCALRYCTIDVKRDEPFIQVLEDKDIEVEFFTAEQLAAVEVPNPSAKVAKHVGTPSVCEAAAILGSGGGELIVPKMKGKNWTAAMAIKTHPRPLPSGRGEAGAKMTGAEISRGQESLPSRGDLEGSAGASSWEAQKAAARQRKKLEQAVNEAEEKVAQLEAALHLLEDKMATPEGAADTTLYESYTRFKQQLETAEEEWMTASEALAK